MIPSFFELTSRPDLQSARPWLILGKGPTFSQFGASEADANKVLALNHAMRGTRALVGHAIDLEVFEALSQTDLDSVDHLCVPWIPHVRQHRVLDGGRAFFGPGHENLDEACARLPVLERYRSSGRLFTYNLVSASPGQRRPDLPLVVGHTFSAAVATRLLAMSGARVIRTLGVDGGNRYSSSFADLEAGTKLQTAQTSFDSQFAEIADTVRTFNLDFGPLHTQVPVRVFVGCMPEQELAYRVLLYSIRRHASISVDVRRLDLAVASERVEIPTPREERNRGRTPFSLQRFAIPSLTNFKGRAVYVDSDMLVVRDIRSLWMQEMHGAQMLSVAEPKNSTRAPQFSVMLLDCEALNWNPAEIVGRLDAGEWTYEQLMYGMCAVDNWAASLPEGWNSLERFVESETHLVHFTDMDGQPWLNPHHPLGTLWTQYLLDAIREGEIHAADVAREVALGNVRPSLLEQIGRTEPDARKLPFSALKQDLFRFVPPHKRAARGRVRIRHELQRLKLAAAGVVRRQLVPAVLGTARSMKTAIQSRFSR